MQNRPRSHHETSKRARRAVDWRRWYAASMVGLAAFLIGLILWPSKPLVRRTSAIVHVDTSALPAGRLMELETELLAIQDELLDPERLSVMIAELENAGTSSQESIDAQAFREAMHVIPDEFPGEGDENPGTWGIRFAMNGCGSELELRLVNRLATEFALEWQRRFVEVETSHDVREIRSAMLEVLRSQSALAEEADDVSHRQAAALQNALQRFSSRIESDDSNHALVLDPASSGRQSADARAFQLASSTPRALETSNADPRFANESIPGGSGQGQLQENPQWRSLNLRLQQLRQQRFDLQRANPDWTDSHWQLRQLADEASFIADQLAHVSPYVSNRALTNDPLAQNGVARVETNQFYRPREPSREAADGLDSGAQTVRFIQPTDEELASIQSEVLAPMEALRGNVVASKSAHDQALQALNSIVLQEPKILQADAHLVQPATTYLLASTNGTWRIIFLMLTSISGAVFFGTVFRTELDSRLSSSHEVESQLGVPVIGCVGDAQPSHEPTWLERLQPANTIFRSAEGIVFALLALVFITVLFNSRMAVDLAESPLLTISEILGSLIRRG